MAPRQQQHLDVQMKWSMRDFIMIITIAVPIIGIWYRVSEVEKKVDVIYTHYVMEGLNSRQQGSGGGFPPVDPTKQTPAGVLPGGLEVKRRFDWDYSFN